MKDELELAIQYLKIRAVSTLMVNHKLMRQFVAVVPISEIESVLEMVKNNEFKNFFHRMKELSHPKSPIHKIQDRNLQEPSGSNLLPVDEETKYHFAREILFTLKTGHAIGDSTYLNWIDKLNNDEEASFLKINLKQD